MPETSHYAVVYKHRCYQVFSKQPLKATDSLVLSYVLYLTIDVCLGSSPRTTPSNRVGIIGFHMITVDNVLKPLILNVDTNCLS